MAAHRDPLGKRLDSWKEIAAFFGRAERTVKRWESERGLPVHRVPGSGRSSVFAYSDELADWLKGRSHELDADESGESSPAGHLRSEAAAHNAILAPPATTVPISLPARSPLTGKRLTLARIAAWALPLLLAGGLMVYFSASHGALHVKALAGRHAPNPEAQDLYLKGRYYWDRRTPEDLNKAVDYFTQAIVKDPSEAQAYVGLADCYNLLREFGAMPPTEAYPRALSAARRAVELDDTSAEAHNSLAFATYWWSWQGVTAEREFKRALQLNPNLVRAHHWYATYLLGQRRLPEALDQIEQAQKLEPSSAAILADKAYILWHLGHNNEGITLLTQLEASEPSLSSTHGYLGEIYWEQHDYAKSLAESRRSAELRHDDSGLAIARAREKGFAANGLPGLYQSELPILKDLVDRSLGSAYALATVYAALGQRQEAISYLQVSYDRREASMLMGDPIPELQNDPGYRRFRAQVNERLAQ